MLRWVAAGMVALGMACAASAQGHARARLVSEYQTILPGATNWLGLTFDIDPGWHLYWNGQNDSGFPITFKVSAPEGYTVGPALWPAPMRHVNEGDILDHVYEKQVTILIPVEAPAHAQPGSTASFHIDAEWLVCKTVCVPGKASVSLDLPVGSPDGAIRISPDRPLLEKSRETVPKPLPSEHSPAKLTWHNDSLEISVPGAKALVFCPGLQTTANFTNLVKDGESSGDMLRLRFEPGSPRIAGDLEVGGQSGGAPTVYWIDSGLSGANPPAAEPSNTSAPTGADIRK